MAAEDYVKLVGRKESPLFVSFILRGFNQHFKQAMEIDYSVQDYRYENAWHCLSKKDATALRGALNQRATAGVDFWRSYIARCHQVGERLVSIGTDFSKRDWTTASAETLLEGFDQFAEASKNMTPFLAAVVLLQSMLEQQLKDELQKHPTIADGTVQADAILPELQGSAASTEALEETQNCHRLARDIAADPALTELLSRSVPEFLQSLPTRADGILSRINHHIARYGWLRTHGYRFEPLSAQELGERIQTLIRLRRVADANEISRSVVNLRSLLRCEPSREFSELVEVLGNFIPLRFYRIDVHLRAEVLARPFMNKLADSLGKTRDELIFCIEDEIREGLHGEPLPPQEEIGCRQDNWFTVVLEDNKLCIQSNNEPLVPGGALVIGDSVRGTTASRGRIEGEIRVILGADEMGKVRAGSILVTTMTTPDFMQAIERCSGIVTDEGGILCHAAIISRELAIPCVIGTGNATNTLADKMLVDLDATGVEGTVTRTQ